MDESVIRRSAVPGVATVLQFPGLDGSESNLEGNPGQPLVGSMGMDCSGDAASMVISGTPGLST